MQIQFPYLLRQSGGAKEGVNYTVLFWLVVTVSVMTWAVLNLRNAGKVNIDEKYQITAPPIGITRSPAYIFGASVAELTRMALDADNNTTIVAGTITNTPLPTNTSSPTASATITQTRIPLPSPTQDTERFDPGSVWIAPTKCCPIRIPVTIISEVQVTHVVNNPVPVPIYLTQIVTKVVTVTPSLTGTSTLTSTLSPSSTYTVTPTIEPTFTMESATETPTITPTESPTIELSPLPPDPTESS